ncbi:glycosyltransferase family 2 protein [Paenibacillus sp. KQZ6P-2]|uniref:Glycosyltransferase family 2 protein n=1 Tax=Paenibacillus mangrovi TaxID=2931978 RepID=A0A9X1WSI9_9BACL|nr:glycosyltransferase family A protein [Paenibacillus mangrovi]MCJ8013901.1 glycosyltransferase family 2 protein [Paenibacillus mangrovi]
MEREEAADPELFFYKSHLQQSFVKWMNTNISARPKYALLKRLSETYVQGYSKRGGSKKRGVPLLLNGSAAAVVCASSEEDSLHEMLSELERLPLQEIIVVLNGCKDNSYKITRSHPLVTVIYYPKLLGHDVGRSIGARLTRADAVLFCDGDMVISAEHLAPFLYAVDGGCDAALNDLNGFLPSFKHQDEVTHFKSFLNMVLGRSDLGANSLTAVPHALSGRLIREMDAQHLIVPPKAQALAVLKGYRVKAVYAVNVFSENRKREANTGKGNAVADMIIGDHAEALEEIMGRRGISGFKGSLSRKDVAMRRNAI